MKLILSITVALIILTFFYFLSGMGTGSKNTVPSIGLALTLTPLIMALAVIPFIHNKTSGGPGAPTVYSNKKKWIFYLSLILFVITAILIKNVG